ncbi:MAG: ComEA family DNA-binding protein [Pseudomonadota bacterium]
MLNHSHVVMRLALIAAVVLPLLVSHAWAAGKVNVNTAGAEELAQLENVGQVKAEAIIEYREANGDFESVQALTQVNGVGERTVEINLDRIELE